MPGVASARLSYRFLKQLNIFHVDFPTEGFDSGGQAVASVWVSQRLDQPRALRVESRLSRRVSRLRRVVVGRARGLGERGGRDFRRGL